MHAQMKRTAHAAILVAVGIGTLATTVVGVTSPAGAGARLGPGPPPRAPTASAACKLHHDSTVSWQHMPAKGTELSTQWVPPRGPAIPGVRRLGVKAQGHHSEKTPAGVNATYAYQAHFGHQVFDVRNLIEACS